MESYSVFLVAQLSHCWIKIIPLWNFTSVPLWGFIWMHALSPFDLSPLQRSLLGTTKSKRCRFFWFGKAGEFPFHPISRLCPGLQSLDIWPNAPMQKIWRDKESRKLRHVFLCRLNLQVQQYNMQSWMISAIWCFRRSLESNPNEILMRVSLGLSPFPATSEGIWKK